MISFTIITSTPAVLRDRLIERGIIQQVTINGKVTLVGVRGGLDWIEVPSLIANTRCYLVRMDGPAEDDETAGEVQDNRALLLRTKFGKWVAANSVADTLTAGARSWPARRVGTNLWLLASDDFGVWQ